MKKFISKETKCDLEIIKDVVRNYHFVGDRVKKLEQLGYYVLKKWVGNGGVGTIRSHFDKKGVQISSTTATCGYAGLAYVAVPEDDSLNELEVGEKIFLLNI